MIPKNKNFMAGLHSEPGQSLAQSHKGFYLYMKINQRYEVTYLCLCVFLIHRKEQRAISSCPGKIAPVLYNHMMGPRGMP